MYPSRVRIIFNVLLIFLFLGFLFSPSVVLMTTEKSIWSETEKRRLASPPSLPAHPGQLADFFAAADEYFNDQFGFREFYIRRYLRELDKRFNIATNTSTVIKGLDGWYFLDLSSQFKDFFGHISLNQRQLQAWLSSQQEKHDWLHKRGIHYMYFAAPNKQSIYPQYLMKHALALKGTSRFEQLLKYTDNQLPKYMINLHHLLKTQAFDKQLYYKNDSHWNKLGAYVAFQKVFEKIAEWFPDEEFTTEFAFAADKIVAEGNLGKGGDLVNMLMQPELTEASPQLKEFKRCGMYKPIPSYLSNIIKGGGRDSFIRECSSKNLKAVIFRDSFFVPLEPFFSENFKEVIYLWKEFDQQNIEEIMVHFKPDIVIEALVEREMFISFLESER